MKSGIRWEGGKPFREDTRPSPVTVPRERSVVEQTGSPATVHGNRLEGFSAVCWPQPQSFLMDCLGQGWRCAFPVSFWVMLLVRGQHFGKPRGEKWLLCRSQAGMGLNSSSSTTSSGSLRFCMCKTQQGNTYIIGFL